MAPWYAAICRGASCGVCTYFASSPGSVEYAIATVELQHIGVGAFRQGVRIRINEGTGRMRAVGPARVTRGRIDVGIGWTNGIHERHQTSELDGGSVRTGNLRHIASATRDRNGRSDQGDVGNVARVPSHIKESFRINSFLGPVAVHVLRDTERDVWHVENGGGRPEWEIRSGKRPLGRDRGRAFVFYLRGADVSQRIML